MVQSSLILRYLSYKNNNTAFKGPLSPHGKQKLILSEVENEVCSINSFCALIRVAACRCRDGARGLGVHLRGPPRGWRNRSAANSRLLTLVTSCIRCVPQELPSPGEKVPLCSGAEDLIAGGGKNSQILQTFWKEFPQLPK